ncbi:hypothetical protein BD413DRAFT_678083 [Trametes elegans]|nr:hypothetical protein BD413DRAFT_678083 [Trametes elegans]
MWFTCAATAEFLLHAYVKEPSIMSSWNIDLVQDSVQKMEKYIDINMSSLTVDTQQAHSTDMSLDTAAVFDGTSFEDLSRDIGILTSTLVHLPASPPTSSGRSTESAEATGAHVHKRGEKGVSSLLGHISTLLTVSTTGDKYVATVNAVIGQYEPGGGISIVVSYNGKVTADPSTSPRIPSLQPVHIGDDQRARDLLDPSDTSQMHTKALAIQDHLQDVCTVLAYILKVPYSQRKEDVAALRFFDLFCFIMRRAHVKLGARLSNMEEFWNKQNPVQIMLDSWAKDGTPRFNDVVDGRLAVEPHIELLEKHHIVPPHFNPQTDKVFVTTENAKHWLEATIELLNTLKSTLFDDKGKNVAFLPSIKAYDILIASLDLEFILKSFFKIVFNKAPRTVEEDLRSNYTAGMENRLRKRAVWSAIRAGKLAAVTDITYDREEEITVMDSPIQESGENPVSHVQRFLKTLIAWCTACKALFYHRRQVTSLHIFSFHTAAYSTISTAEVHTFRTRYFDAMFRHPAVSDTPAIREQVNIILDLLLPKADKTVVTHAEAGLMALVLDQRSRHAVVKLPMDDGDLNALFSASGRVDIGVSKKCCYCCDILAKLINASPQGGLMISLPGSHGTIFPWLPPSFGINTEHLQQLRNKLFIQFHDIVVKQIVDLASTQLSPVSDDSEDSQELELAIEQWKELIKQRAEGLKGGC